VIRRFKSIPAEVNLVLAFVVALVASGGIAEAYSYFIVG
jgi:hypothetical protein